jgi:hypothetical protein
MGKCWKNLGEMRENGGTMLGKCEGNSRKWWEHVEKMGKWRENAGKKAVSCTTDSRIWMAAWAPDLVVGPHQPPSPPQLLGKIGWFTAIQVAIS